MKTLVIFYSRTGTTKKVAEEIAQKISAEIEVIYDTVDRMGAKGYLISGRDSMKRKLTTLEKININMLDYDLIVIGTPIWAWNMSVPIRTFLNENKNKIKKAAFFCTMSGSGDKKAFLEMEQIICQKPVSTLALTTKEVIENKHSEKIEKFVLTILKTQ